MLFEYNTSQSELKRKRFPKKEERPDVVDLSRLVPGIKDMKLAHHFPGVEVEALKVKLFVNKRKQVRLPKWRTLEDGTDIPFGYGSFNTAFAEPGSKELNAFLIEGYEGQQDMKELLMDFNIEIMENANIQKLHKRLKRALLVACYAKETDLDIRVTPNTALPEPLIDGCFLINLEKAQEIADKNGLKVELKAWDTLQASLAWSEGLAKGTAICYPGLNADVVVQECNIKREVRFLRQPLLCFEGFHHARTPCTDIQTVCNLMAPEGLERASRHHLHMLMDIADNPESADAWYTEHFEHHDWWPQAVDAHLKYGKPLPNFKPPLSIARETGIKRIAQTPVLKEVTYKHACKTLDIRELKARLPKGEAVAGYLIGDTARIDADGHLKNSPLALRPGEIRAPSDGKNSIPADP